MPTGGDSRTDSRATEGGGVRDVREAGLALIERQKQRAADAVHGIAESVRSATRSIRQDDVPLAGYITEAADRLDALSVELRERRIAELVGNLETVARQRPALFAFGAVALGVVVGRLVTAAASAARASEDGPPTAGPRSAAA